MTELAIVPWYKRIFGLGVPRLEPEPPLVHAEFRAVLPRGGGTAAVEQGPTQTWREWTPDLLRLAEISADRGDLSLAADLCDALVADAVIASKLGERVRSLVGAPITFVEGQGRSKKAAKKAAEAGEDFWRLLPDAEYTQLCGWGFLLGVGLGQMRDWAPSGEHGGRVVPAALDVWHMRDVRFLWDRRAWVARDALGREVEVRSGDGQWFLFTPFGRSRPWVHGLWRQVARVWLLKNLAISEWQRANQANAAKVVTANTPSAESDALDDYTDAVRRRLVSELRAMGRNAVVALPPGLDLKLLEIGADTWESFNAQCALCDQLVAVAFVGSSLATSGDKASFASSQTGQEVKRDIRAGDANVEQTLVHDDVMRPWAHLNFGDAAAAPWPQRQVDPAPTLAELNAQLLGFGQAIEALRDKAGLPVDAEEMSKAVPAIVLLPTEKRTRGQAPIYEYHIQNPILTVNEIRDRLGYGTIDGGDAFPSEVAAGLAQPAEPPPGRGGGPGGVSPGEPPPGANDAGKTTPKGKADALAMRARYAKGGVPEGPALEGQLYADRLVERAQGYGPGAFKDVLAATMAAVEASKDYDELRARLVALAGDADLETDARDLLEHLALMAWAAGAHSGDRELEGGAEA